MTVLSVLASVFGVVLGLAGLPQVIKVYRTKSARDIAPLTYIIIEIGSFIWVLYGLELGSAAIVVTNLLGFIVTTVMLVGYYLYGRGKKKR